MPHNGQPIKFEKLKIDLKKKLQEEMNAKRSLDESDNDVSGFSTNGNSSCKDDFSICQYAKLFNHYLTTIQILIYFNLNSNLIVRIIHSVSLINPF